MNVFDDVCMNYDKEKDDFVWNSILQVEKRSTKDPFLVSSYWDKKEGSVLPYGKPSGSYVHLYRVIQLRLDAIVKCFFNPF